MTQQIHIALYLLIHTQPNPPTPIHIHPQPLFNNPTPKTTHHSTTSINTTFFPFNLTHRRPIIIRHFLCDLSTRHPNHLVNCHEIILCISKGIIPPHHHWHYPRHDLHTSQRNTTPHNSLPSYTSTPNHLPSQNPKVSHFFFFILYPPPSGQPDPPTIPLPWTNYPLYTHYPVYVSIVRTNHTTKNSCMIAPPTTNQTNQSKQLTRITPNCIPLHTPSFNPPVGIMIMGSSL